MLFEEQEDAHRFLDQLHPRTRAKLGSRWSVAPVRLNRGPGDDVTAIVMNSGLNPTDEITFAGQDRDVDGLECATGIDADGRFYMEPAKDTDE